YDIEEVLARIRALLRRADTNLAATDAATEATPLRAGPVALEPEGRRAWAHGREVALSRTECDLLELLLRNAGIVLSHQVIYERIWGYDFGPDSKNLAVF